MYLNYKKAKETDVDYIIAMLSGLYPISKALAKEFKKHAITISLETDEHILKEGGICNYMYFIKSGAMMGYTIHKEKQIITYISVENEFVSSLSGLYGQQPSREAIKAIEPTVLLGVNTDILLGWYEKFFDLNYIIRKVYESYYRDAQERSHIVRVGDAKERYLYFLRTRNKAVERLPVEILAPFLDMKPQTLIRVKKEVNKGVTNEGSKELMNDIQEFIIKNETFRDKKASLKSLSRDINLSVSVLSNAIKSNLKLSFKDFINGYRIDYFKQLLKDVKHLRSFTIESLSADSGFSSRSGFYAAFKKREGISPKNLLQL